MQNWEFKRDATQGKDEVEYDIRLVKASVEGSQESSKLFHQSA